MFMNFSDSMNPLIAVCGSDGDDSRLSDYAVQVAEDVGVNIARNHGILICGGRGGIMEAACRGAKKENGITVGILPNSKEEANEFVDIPLVTGLGHRRNFLVVNSADVIIAISGRWGTLNEISFAIIFDKPVILIKGTGGMVDRLITDVFHDVLGSKCFIVDSAKEAVDKAFEEVNKKYERI